MKNTIINIEKGKGCHLQKCKKTDIHLLLQIAHQSYREHYQYLWKDKGEGYIKSSYNAEAFAAEIADSKVLVYFILVGQEVCGFLKLNLQSSFEKYEPEAVMEVERIHLLKAATGKGVGTTVMAAVAQIAIAHNKKVIWLKTMDSSKAVSFYQKCGYEVCGKANLKIEELFQEYQGQWIMKKLL